MERAVWVHQFDQLDQSTPEQIAATLAPRGITRVYAKSMDGMDWMSSFYEHPLVPSHPGQLSELVASFAAVDLQLIPWVVPRWSPDEAQTHLVCGRVAGGLVVDFEFHYAGFWAGSEEAARRYVDTLRSARDEGLWVGVSPDARQIGRDYSPDLLAGLSAYLPQAYWTDFRRPWEEALADAFDRCQSLGPTEPVLPSDAAPDDLQAAVAWCEARPCEAVSLWRLGAASAERLLAFARTPPAAEPGACPPVPDVYADRGWTTWPAVAANLEGIVQELLAERDALASRLAGQQRAISRARRGRRTAQ